MNTNKKKKEIASTQQYVPIADIRDGTIVMKDGSMRLVLLTTSINFNLKSQNEQNAIIYGYQRFLNALTFPIQIVMQSRRLDLTGYLTELKERIPQTESELLRLQIQDYIEFINRLLSVANIMNKRFYVVIPYFPPLIKSDNFIDKIKNKLKTDQTIVDVTSFKKYQKELRERANVVASGLSGIGIRAAQLTTKELLELFYQSYNPDLSTKEVGTD